MSTQDAPKGYKRSFIDTDAGKDFRINKLQTEIEALRKENARLQKYDGNDEHPENRCERCLGRNLNNWYTDSDVWNRIVGDKYSIICPNCLNELSNLQGEQPTAWRVSKEGDNPEVDKLRMRIHELNNELAAAQVEIARMQS